jgi:hypothetical protein
MYDPPPFVEQSPTSDLLSNSNFIHHSTMASSADTTTAPQVSLDLDVYERLVASAKDLVLLDKTIKPG